MAEPRIFVEQPLAAGNQVELTDAAHRHVAHALRMAAGDPLVLFNGTGGEFAGVVDAVGKNSTLARVAVFRPANRESSLNLTLLQAVAKGERMDVAIQKSVELGVTAIGPVLSERCNVRLDAERWEAKRGHWLGVIRSACEQSGRTRVPELHSVRSLDEWLAAPPEGVRLFLDPDGDARLPREGGSAGVCVLIGPEGGLSPEECAAARRAGFAATKLGPRILRTETAGPAAIAALQAMLGDWS